mgnify:CR=1 FL=1
MGFGCKGQLPGMGGVNQSENFLLNCSGWKDFFNEIIKTDKMPPFYVKIWLSIFFTLSSTKKIILKAIKIIT